MSVSGWWFQHGFELCASVLKIIIWKSKYKNKCIVLASVIKNPFVTKLCLLGWIHKIYQRPKHLWEKSLMNCMKPHEVMSAFMENVFIVCQIKVVCLYVQPWRTRIKGSCLWELTRTCRDKLCDKHDLWQIRYLEWLFYFFGKKKNMLVRGW